ncbi:MAG: TIGR03619 family F420-dependent LLM class oxidoreductase [Chloroflexi bacterium]|nr:TIGR03619 family F420-dependent LLM class oxidoreductase [Chloroflexota bacterium]
MDIKFGLGFGLGPGGLPDASGIFRYFDRSEALMYDSMWISDRLVARRPSLDCVTLLAAFAARTKRMLFGPSVLIPALRNPVVLAKQLATLDYLAGGRLVAGFGVGGEAAQEFEAVGVPVNERGRRTDEAIQVMRRLWSDSPASYQGKYYRFDEVVMEPKPLFKPFVPIWIGGQSDAALRRTARLGDGWLASFVSPEETKAGQQKILQYAEEYGREFDGDEFGVLLLTLVAEQGSPVRDRAEAFLEANYRNRRPGPMADVSIMGSPQECIDRLGRYVDVGCNKFVIRFLVERVGLDEQLERFAGDVASAFPGPQAKVPATIL